MGSWKRITLVTSILIGSVSFFGYWSMDQFDQAFDNLSALSVANTLSAPPPFKKEVEIASTSPEVSNIFATSTDQGLTFTFLQKDTGIYIGCTYPISLQASTTIVSIEAALIEAGTRDAVEQKISGLTKENAIEDSQHITWEVGDVLPGAYYIKISKIDDAKAAVRSNVFEIHTIPEGLDEEAKNSLCR